MSQGIENNTPGGRGSPTPQYGTSGNELYTGGPNAFPKSTRVKQLLEILKKLKKKD